MAGAGGREDPVDLDSWEEEVVLPPPPPRASSSAASAEWQCVRCTLLNPRSRATCEACFAIAVPPDSAAARPSAMQPRIDQHLYAVPRTAPAGRTADRASALASAVLADLEATRERARARAAAGASVTASAETAPAPRSFALPAPAAPARPLAAASARAPEVRRLPAARPEAEAREGLLLGHTYAGERAHALAAAALFDRLEAEEAAEEEAERRGAARGGGGWVGLSGGGGGGGGVAGRGTSWFGCDDNDGGSSCGRAGSGGFLGMGAGGAHRERADGYGLGSFRRQQQAQHAPAAQQCGPARQGRQQHQAQQQQQAADGWRCKGSSGPPLFAASGGAGAGAGGVPGSSAGRRAPPTPAMRQAMAAAAHAQAGRRSAVAAALRGGAARPAQPPPQPAAAAAGARRSSCGTRGNRAFGGGGGADDEGMPAAASGRRMQLVGAVSAAAAAGGGTGSGGGGGERGAGSARGAGADAARLALLAARRREAEAAAMLLPSLATFHRSALAWPPHALESVALPLPGAPTAAAAADPAGPSGVGAAEGAVALPSAAGARRSAPPGRPPRAGGTSSFGSAAEHATTFLPLLLLEARAQLSSAAAEALPLAQRVCLSVLSVRTVDDFTLVEVAVVDPEAAQQSVDGAAAEDANGGNGGSARAAAAAARERMKRLLSGFVEDNVFVVRPGHGGGGHGSGGGERPLCALAKVEAREGSGASGVGHRASDASGSDGTSSLKPSGSGRAGDVARVTLRLSLLHAPQIAAPAGDDPSAAQQADAARRRGVLSALRPRSAWSAWHLSSFVTLNREFRALASLPRLRSARLLLRPQLQLRCALPAGAAAARAGGDGDGCGRGEIAPPPPRPAGVPAALWAALSLRLNSSQLAAIAQAAAHGAATLAPAAAASASATGAAGRAAGGAGGGCGSGDAADGCRITLIQGPPGTGKTTVIVSLLAALLAQRRRAANAAAARRGASSGAQASDDVGGDHGSGVRALVCAPSNAAVDELARRLLCSGLLDENGRPYAPRLLRLGATACPALERIALHAQLHGGQAAGEVSAAADGGDGGGGRGKAMADGPGSRGGSGGGGGASSGAEARKAAASSRRAAALDELAAVRHALDGAHAAAPATAAAAPPAAEGDSAARQAAAAASAGSVGAAAAAAGGGGGAPNAELIAALMQRKRAAQRELRQAGEALELASTALSAESARHKRGVISRAEVVCCTLSGAGADTLVELALPKGSSGGGGVGGGGGAGGGGAAGSADGGHGLRFPLVIVDEAAQAVELSTLIPFKYGCRHAVLVGDPKQLPATVLSTEAARCLYAEGLFHRCVRAGLEPTVLSVQYRMHPDISLFPGLHFYDGRLRDGVRADERAERWHATAGGALGPFAFHSVGEGRELAGGAGSSLRNDAEAAHVARLLRALRVHAPELFERAPAAAAACGGHARSGAEGGARGAAAAGCAAVGAGRGGGAAGALPSDLGAAPERVSVACIAPYKEQVRALRRAACALLGDAQVARYTASGCLDFATVDGFQGQEVRVLLYSATRASASAGLGFVADMRRLNVALTRARSSLVLVGHAPTLGRNGGRNGNGQFGALLAHAQAKGVLLEAEEALLRCEATPPVPLPSNGAREAAGAAGAVGGKRAECERAGDGGADESQQVWLDAAKPLSKRPRSHS